MEDADGYRQKVLKKHAAVEKIKKQIILGDKK
jgi:hypothetical protein